MIRLYIRPPRPTWCDRCRRNTVRIVGGLKLSAVTLGPEIDPGVPALASGGGETIALALKSGNFGSVDFFAKALRMLKAG
jgi:uncharacterized protein YgbK (DUF1537 family)